MVAIASERVRSSERVRESGPTWSGSDHTSTGLDPFGLTSVPSGKTDFSELV
jgi:hypothetical protein